MVRDSRKLALRRLAFFSGAAPVLATLACVVPACSDVGDSYAPPPNGGVDGSLQDSSSPSSGAETGAQDAGSGSDGTVADAQGADVVVAETEAPEAAGGPDGAEMTETGPQDTGAADAPADTILPDNVDGSVADAGEAGSDGSIVMDASEAGHDGGVLMDASEAGQDGMAEAASDATEEAPADAPSDVVAETSPPALAACTASAPTDCVQCQDNTADNGICTPTEAILVDHDIALKIATAPGPDPADGCYTCLNANHLLDDNKHDTGNECEDMGGAGFTVGTTAECTAVLTCILGSGNGTPASSCSGDAVNNCYCGPEAPGTACANAGTAVNGACDQQIATGLGIAFGQDTAILEDLLDQTKATGIATTLFQGAIDSNCNACLE